MHLGAFEATLVMLGSSPPSLSLLLGVIRGFGFYVLDFRKALILVMFGCLSLVSLVFFFLSSCILSSPSVLSWGSSSFSVWVHIRGLELTTYWFEY